MSQEKTSYARLFGILGLGTIGFIYLIPGTRRSTEKKGRGSRGLSKCSPNS